MIPYKLFRIATTIKISVSKQQAINTAFKSKENFDQFLKEQDLSEQEFWKLLYNVDQKYIDWLAREWYAGNYRFPEDSEAAKRRIQEFKKFKPRLNKLGLSPNILDYTKDELIKTLKKFEEEAPKLKNEAKEKKIDSLNLPGVKKIQGGSLLIYEISNPESLVILSQDPNIHIDWCVRHKETAEDYIQERGAHYLFIKDGKNYILGSFLNSEAEFKFPDDAEVSKEIMEYILPAVMKKIYPKLTSEKKLGFLSYLINRHSLNRRDFEEEINHIYSQKDPEMLYTIHMKGLKFLTKEDLIVLAKNPKTCLKIKTTDPEIIDIIKTTVAYRSKSPYAAVTYAEEYGAWDPNTERGKVALFRIAGSIDAVYYASVIMKKPWDPNTEIGKKALESITSHPGRSADYARYFSQPWDPNTEIGKKALEVINADPRESIEYYLNLGTLPSPTGEGTLRDELKIYLDEVFSHKDESKQYEVLKVFLEIPKPVDAFLGFVEEAALGPKLAYEAFTEFSGETLNQFKEIVKKPKEFMKFTIDFMDFFRNLALTKKTEEAIKRLENLFTTLVPKETIREIISEDGFKYISSRMFEKQMDELLKDFNIDLEKIKKETPKDVLLLLEEILSKKMPGISQAAKRHINMLEIRDSRLPQEVKKKLLKLNEEGNQKQVREAILNYVGRDKFTKEEWELLRTFEGTMDFLGKKISILTKENVLAFLCKKLP